MAKNKVFTFVGDRDGNEEGGKYVSIPIQRLLDDNPDLMSYEALASHHGKWGDPRKSKIDDEKAENWLHDVNILSKKGPDGKIRMAINDGQHRINAMKNSGYTHLSTYVKPASERGNDKLDEMAEIRRLFAERLDPNDTIYPAFGRFAKGLKKGFGGK